MDNEEKKIEPAPVIEPESDFADEVKLEDESKKEEAAAIEDDKAKKAEEAKAAEEKAKAEIAEAKEKAKEYQHVTVVKNKKVISYDYSDERLAKVEEARKVFDGAYGKRNKVKSIVSFVALGCIIIGWILPTTLIKDNTNLALGITLGIAVIAIVAIAIVSLLSKNKNKVSLKEYFSAFYENVDSFAFDGLPIENLKGNVDNKITEAEMNACLLYPDVKAVGSRNAITFTYNGLDCALADAAAQKDSGKGLTTVFVGKYLRTANKVAPKSPLVIYFHGNERALPPEQIKSMERIDGTSEYDVYGNVEDKKILKKEIKSILKNIHTDRLLVDVAISIQEGKTYFALGYEDELMVLPMKEAFNPYYVIRYKEGIKSFFEIAELLNK